MSETKDSQEPAEQPGDLRQLMAKVQASIQTTGCTTCEDRREVVQAGSRIGMRRPCPTCVEPQEGQVTRPLNLEERVRNAFFSSDPAVRAIASRSYAAMWLARGTKKGSK